VRLLKLRRPSCPRTNERNPGPRDNPTPGLAETPANLPRVYAYVANESLASTGQLLSSLSLGNPIVRAALHPFTPTSGAPIGGPPCRLPPHHRIPGAQRRTRIKRVRRQRGRRRRPKTPITTTWTFRRLRNLIACHPNPKRAAPSTDRKFIEGPITTPSGLLVLSAANFQYWKSGCRRSSTKTTLSATAGAPQSHP
jgi:hypothetical protein